VNTLRDRNNTNSTTTAEALTTYFGSISSSNVTSTSNNTLTIDEIDSIIDNLNGTSFVGNTSSSYIIVQPVRQENKLVLGASTSGSGNGTIVDTSNRESITNSIISTAAIISNESLTGVTYISMLIIDNPIQYRRIDNTSNKTLASSIIVAAVQRDPNITQQSINISLFFQVLNDSKPNTTNVDYYCSFYDTHSSQWNESGCTKPNYNQQWNRYECSCNHLTSFALIWLPNTQYTQNLNAQDIASLVFQSISIICFIIVISHALFIRFRDPLMRLQAYDLLPLISAASTTILFIFYIALGTTVYTRTTSEEETECFLSSSVLMFFVYFFVIFMFCTKTSVGYFNYLRFVLLFPQPRARKLVRMLIISFFISITWVSFAAGFNSNPSYNITQLYPYKLCWFTRDVIHYFFTIPIGIFLLINIVLFLCVAVRVINHARYATSRDLSYDRMKRCIVVLLSSSLTQGIGWLFGPVITVVGSEAGNVLGWFFNVFNGLEGLWTLLLYAILHSMRIDEKKRVKAVRELESSKDTEYRRRRRSSSGDSHRNRNRNEDNDPRTTVTDDEFLRNDNRQNEFADLQYIRGISYPTDTAIIDNDNITHDTF